MARERRATLPTKSMVSWISEVTRGADVDEACTALAAEIHVLLILETAARTLHLRPSSFCMRLLGLLVASARGQCKAFLASMTP